MGVYIDKFVPKNGLYQIDQGKIHKYKSKGGTVRVYPIQEIDLVRCGECKYVGKTDVDWVCNGGFEIDCGDPYVGGQAIVHPLDFCSYGERRADEDAEQRLKD